MALCGTQLGLPSPPPPPPSLSASCVYPLPSLNSPRPNHRPQPSPTCRAHSLLLTYIWEPDQIAPTNLPLKNPLTHHSPSCFLEISRAIRLILWFITQ
ncbi:hypothetical protein Pmani_021228 [Petrolisthes manimaculis]|uniref:Uncharacterized protein n=1 Tax=Petrolisthes manimaculis TaxID=1843537 RepID=A0AAE1PE80_9EUCA|nr:hypothetical protein Pmani_021228 [Petrolisthes manimaculis]